MGRKKENKIYSMFAFDENTKKSKCLVEGCSQYIKGNHGANLVRHFYTQHREKYNEIQRLNSENKENYTPTPLGRNAQTVMECCTKLVTIHGRPFSILEDDAFQELLKLIPSVNKKELKVVNVKNIKENICEMAYEVRLQISKEIKDCLLALKVDVASVKLRRFLGLNIQYILNGKIVLRNLSVVELHNRNTGDYLKDNVDISLSRFGIDLRQILTITTDNGSNMLNMVERFEDSLNEILEESIEDTPESTQDFPEVDDEVELLVEGNETRKITSVRCAAHCLQLAVKDACQDLQEFLDQCRQVIRTLRTPNMSLKLKQHNLPQAVIDMPVRWDSTMSMLESLQKLKSFCNENLNVSPEIWPPLNRYLEILQPCKYLSKILQKEQITFGDFYIAWMRCRHRVALKDDPFARRLESCMIYRQANLFSNPNFLAAVYLDPRINSILTQEQKTNARTLLVEIYKRIINLNVVTPQESHELSDSAPQPETSRQGLSDTSNFENYLRQQFTSDNNRPQVSNASLETELIFKLVEFLQEPILRSDSNILEYWETKKITDPYLYNLSKVVLAIPPTSVSVERLFSSLKFVLNNLRMRLHDSIIDDVMIVRNNYLYSK